MDVLAYIFLQYNRNQLHTKELFVKHTVIEKCLSQQETAPDH